MLPNADPLHKVTIVPRGLALGLTQQLPEEDRYLHAKSYLADELVVLMGGRLAEQVVFGADHITTGAGIDLERATELARKMVCEWGMSHLGPLTFGKREEAIFLGKEFARHQDYSESTAVEIDTEIRRLVSDAYKQAQEIITEPPGCPRPHRRGPAGARGAGGRGGLPDGLRAHRRAGGEAQGTGTADAFTRGDLRHASMGIVLRVVHTVIAAVLVALDTVVMGSYGVVVGFVPPRGDWTVRGSRLWARIILWAALVRLRVEGAERVPRDGPVVFMANHESWLDIPVLLASIPVQVRFLAKKSLFGIPFLGWAMTAMGFIPVDRKNRREAVKSFEEAAQRIRTGRSVLIFPEETRTRDDNLLPFQRGGFLIAIKAGIPIVPVGLDGPRRCLATQLLPAARRAASRCGSGSPFPPPGWVSPPRTP